MSDFLKDKMIKELEIELGVRTRQLKNIESLYNIASANYKIYKTRAEKAEAELQALNDLLMEKTSKKIDAIVDELEAASVELGKIENMTKTDGLTDKPASIRFSDRGKPIKAIISTSLGSNIFANQKIDTIDDAPYSGEYWQATAKKSNESLEKRVEELERKMKIVMELRFG